MLSKNRDTDNIILHKLDYSSLEEMSKVNKHFKKICDDDMFWRDHVNIRLGKYLDDNLNKYRFTDTWKEFYRIMEDFEFRNTPYSSIYKEIEEHYEKFVENTFGYKLLKFLTKEYKNLYIKTVHELYIVLDSEVDEDEHSDIISNHIYDIPVPSEHRKGCNVVQDAARENIWELVDFLLKLN